MSGRSPVDPLIAALDDGGPAERLPRGWRTLIALAVVISSLSFVASVVMFGVVYDEGHVRERQFCRTQILGLRDKERQLAQTREFLGNAAGQRDTVFNQFIRQNSLPRLTVEVARQRQGFPSVCRKRRNRL